MTRFCGRPLSGWFPYLPARGREGGATFAAHPKHGRSAPLSRRDRAVHPRAGEPQFRAARRRSRPPGLRAAAPRARGRRAVRGVPDGERGPARAARPSRGPATCRAALGCRVPAAGRPGAGCGGACVVASALARGEDVVDVPVTLPGGRRALLSAAALDDGRRAAVLEVVPIRPARAARRATPGVRIEVLGPARVRTAARPHGGRLARPAPRSAPEVPRRRARPQRAGRGHRRGDLAGRRAHERQHDAPPRPRAPRAPRTGSRAGPYVRVHRVGPRRLRPRPGAR